MQCEKLWDAGCCQRAATFPTLGIGIGDAVLPVWCSKDDQCLQVPDCYRHSPARLQPGYLSKFQVDTLFYIFYSMPNDEAQVLAADELRSRGWLFHKEFKVRSLLLLEQSPHIFATLSVCLHGDALE